METQLISELLAMAICIAFSACFSASETAFSSLNRARMKAMAEQGDKRAERTLALAEQYDRLLSTLLIGNNIGGLGTPIASLDSLISMKAYLRSPGARAGRYLLVFTLANVAALSILTGSVVLMGLIFPG